MTNTNLTILDIAFECLDQILTMFVHVHHVGSKPLLHPRHGYSIIYHTYIFCNLYVLLINHILSSMWYDDVIEWKHFPRYWPSVRGIHRSPMNSPHKGLWHGPLMFSLICVWKNGWVNNRGAGDLKHHRDHYDLTVINLAHALLKDRSVRKDDILDIVCDKHYQYYYSN